MVRPCFFDNNGMKKGAWSNVEDDKLRAYVLRYGHWNWRMLPKYAGLARCGKSCRLRWVNYLKPGLKRGNFTKEEENFIMELHNQLGNKWSAIAANLPGRTDNEIKNYWHTHKKRCNKRKEAATQVEVAQTIENPPSEIETLKESENLMLSPNTANWIARDTTSLDLISVSQDNSWPETFLPITCTSQGNMLPAVPDPFELSSELNFSELSCPDFSMLSDLHWVGDDSVNSSDYGFLGNFWNEPNETNYLLPVEEANPFSPYISYFDDFMVNVS
ncbi:unnamed protein product [Fraxinus pennsylvanica]|uniref:Uncharacterized protein n=1 Tax=Fraxinus pennsylvanica TaxID=56036 RepID=A0AAD2DK76_9LAMI|nr:unnamed protein product [Fraxinus pennsylvanica]